MLKWLCQQPTAAKQAEVYFGPSCSWFLKPHGQEPASVFGPDAEIAPSADAGG